ncbi:MAG: sensor histidine kinase, partial [Candidatus Binatia bacterium]
EKRADIEQLKINITLDIIDASVLTDSEGLAQAMRNYLDNAIKFTRNVQEPSIQIGAAKFEKAHRLWVRDNGIGFDMKYHDRIFEIFQRLHRMEDHPGTGIGLAIARKAAERMGGRVWAESSIGAGATFYLEIPERREAT